MNIVRIDLSKGFVINTDIEFATEYERAMYVNELIEKLYSGCMKVDELNKAQYALIAKELGDSVDIKRLYRFNEHNNILSIS